jgi:hypothetical protein
VYLLNFHSNHQFLNWWYIADNCVFNFLIHFATKEEASTAEASIVDACDVDALNLDALDFRTPMLGGWSRIRTNFSTFTMITYQVYNNYTIHQISTISVIWMDTTIEIYYKFSMA